MKYFIPFFVGFSILLLSGCSSTVPTVNYSYNPDCINCNLYKDSILSFSFPKVIYRYSPIILTITNNSNDVVVLDERLFSFMENNMIKMNPIGENNPNNSFTKNLQTATSVKAESGTVQGDTKGSSFDNLLKSTFSGKQSSRSTSYEMSEGYSVTINPQPIISIPPKSYREYNITNYMTEYYYLALANSSEYDGRGSRYTDYDTLKTRYESLKIPTWSYNIIYKYINEQSWRNATVSIRVNGLKLEVERENEE